MEIAHLAAYIASSQEHRYPVLLRFSQDGIATFIRTPEHMPVDIEPEVGGPKQKGMLQNSWFHSWIEIGASTIDILTAKREEMANEIDKALEDHGYQPPLQTEA